MIIGIPKEIKKDEYRVAILPSGVESLVKHKHKVLVEKNAGLGSGISNEDFKKAGAQICPVGELFKKSQLIVKVKEPQPDEYSRLQKGQILFTYLHLAASKPLTLALKKTAAYCIAYETIEKPDGSLPLLTAMSEVAGRMAVQEGAKYLENPTHGRGKLLSGIPGVSPAEVMILGGGVVGTNAAKVAAGLGAQVTLLDVNLSRLRYLSDILPANVKTIMSDSHAINYHIKNADLVIGAVLIPGAKAPKLIGKSHLKMMKPGSVIVDVAIDQGGCTETSKPTSHSNPIYIVNKVVHYCVANIPGAVGRTSTYGLCNSTFPYLLKLANMGLMALKEDMGFKKGLNVAEGKITHPAVAKAFGLSFSEYSFD